MRDFSRKWVRNLCSRRYIKECRSLFSYPNMQMKRKFLFLVTLCAFVIFLPRVVKAQYHYDLGLGVKIGSPWMSGTIKYFINDASAVEGLFHLGDFGFGTTALYEYHFMIGGVPGLRWYIGGGGHLAFQTSDGYNPFTGVPKSNKAYAGFDGVGGVEYVFEKVPITIGADISPIVNVLGTVSGWWNAGTYVRYTFK